mgnify:FL=1
MKSILFGITGAGKSTLTNFMIDSNEAVIGNTIRSCTTTSKSYSGTIANQQIEIIDTPGFCDTEGNDKTQIKSMLEFLKKQKEANNFSIVFNFQDERFTPQYQTIIRQLYKIFDNGKIFDNMALIFTHCFGADEE